MKCMYVVNVSKTHVLIMLQVPVFMFLYHKTPVNVNIENQCGDTTQDFKCSL